MINNQDFSSEFETLTLETFWLTTTEPKKGADSAKMGTWNLNMPPPSETILSLEFIPSPSSGFWPYEDGFQLPYVHELLTTYMI